MRHAVLPVVLALGLLAGCSETPEDVRADYCEQVAEQQPRLTELLADDSPDALLRALPLFRDLRDAAPRDVADEWDRFVTALSGLERALDEAGVDPASYDADDPPSDVTPEQRRAVATAADELVRPEVAEAYEGVKQHAKDVCRTPLFQ